MSFQDERLLNMMQQMPQYEKGSYDEVVAQVDFELSTHPDPKKQRRQNIKRALKALKPTKRSFFSPRRYWFRGKYAYTRPHQCAVDGTNCMNQDYGDLFNQYFRDPHTMQVQRFRVWTGVVPGQGKQLESTYCPQHMMLFHKLNEWLEQEEAEADPNFFQKLAKKGVALVPVKKSPKKEEHPLIVKWTPVFMEARKDGIPVVHYRNPVTGDNDITMLVFDNRVLQATMPSDNTLSSTMDMAKYHKVVEEMSRQ
tara:strand:+ start:3463 stop:4221 length:759 start_codon:yes stop_codon:yes gene_type:complete